MCYLRLYFKIRTVSKEHDTVPRNFQRTIVPRNYYLLICKQLWALELPEPSAADVGEIFLKVWYKRFNLTGIWTPNQSVNFPCFSTDFQLVESPVLQTWIPAAMSRGTGARKHHVYQVCAFSNHPTRNKWRISCGTVHILRKPGNAGGCRQMPTINYCLRWRVDSRPNVSNLAVTGTLLAVMRY